jgi:hypothetical protein
MVIAWYAAGRWARAKGRWQIAPAVLVALWLAAVVTSLVRDGRGPAILSRPTATVKAAAISRAPHRPHPLPSEYVPSSPELDRDGLGGQLYLNGAGWNATTGVVAPGLYFFVEDPAFFEVEVEPADAEVRAKLDLHHLAVAERTGGRVRFAVPEGVRGLHVVFVAFGSDMLIDRKATDIVLRRVRWR